LNKKDISKELKLEETKKNKYSNGNVFANSNKIPINKTLITTKNEKLENLLNQKVNGPKISVIKQWIILIYIYQFYCEIIIFIN